jgi:hypothetical protein
MYLGSYEGRQAEEERAFLRAALLSKPPVGAFAELLNPLNILLFDFYCFVVEGSNLGSCAPEFSAVPLSDFLAI